MSSVDARDVAAAATAVLIDEVDDDVYTLLTGPQALTGVEMAAALAAVPAARSPTSTRLKTPVARRPTGRGASSEGGSRGPNGVRGAA